MTITNRQRNAVKALTNKDDRIIRQDGEFTLVRDMHTPRRHNGGNKFDMGYWAVLSKGKEEA